MLLEFALPAPEQVLTDAQISGNSWDRLTWLARQLYRLPLELRRELQSRLRRHEHILPGPL